MLTHELNSSYRVMSLAKRGWILEKLVPLAGGWPLVLGEVVYAAARSV
jgi:hypothetical protein